MMFGSNEEIISKLQNTIPALKDQALTIQWAFISKAKDYPNRKEKDARFQYDQGLRLDYMEDDGHAEVPAKTISMLVSDANGNCVLEMPLMVLNSPFTALYRLG
jgi:phage baseplate assembly protein gpV